MKEKIKTADNVEIKIGMRVWVCPLFELEDDRVIFFDAEDFFVIDITGVNIKFVSIENISGIISCYSPDSLYAKKENMIKARVNMLEKKIKNAKEKLKKYKEKTKNHIDFLESQKKLIC